MTGRDDEGGISAERHASNSFRGAGHYPKCEQPFQGDSASRFCAEEIMPSETSSEIDDLLQSLGFLSANPSGVTSRQKPLPKGNVVEEAATPPAASPGSAAASPSSKFESAALAMFRSVGRFFPYAPENLQEAGLGPAETGHLILRYLAIRGIETGFNIARQLGMKFPLVEVVLRQLKSDRLVSYKNSSTGGDYHYEITDHGRERASYLTEQCSYMGTAPVPLDVYIESVKAQSISSRKPALAAIRAAFEDLQVGDRILSAIGQAVHSGRGMFLFGPAGNGKTSMAERITRSFGDTIWIPRAITASGEIIRLYDPNRHKAAPPSGCDPEILDGRWIQIERPTIIAGGELRMDDLEINYIRRTGIGEAPLQMKANCGTLLIDDFGRQRMSIDELLNRWIVPLEQRYDYLHLESGRSIQIPFDQLIIFSSNLEPRDLVDEAFLRRIPYKIEVRNPSEEEFRSLFRKSAEQFGFAFTEDALNYLIDVHYHKAGRTFRFCHPRDLLRQMANRSSLHQLEMVVDQDSVDEAVENYFSIM
jgi:predicted ATPase with chaperone activity